jgi:Family of unknown function (DUF5677)
MPDDFPIYFIDTFGSDQQPAYDRYMRVLSGMRDHLRKCMEQLQTAIRIVAIHQAAPDKIYHLTTLGLARHVMVQVDGVSILAEQGAGECCGPPLRSACEGYFGILHILAADTERRALSYVVSHYRRRLKMHTELDGSTPEGATLRAEAAGEAEAAALAAHRPIPDAITNCQRELRSPSLAPIDAEWQRLKAANPHQDPHWYSLFNGPRSFRQLAQVHKKYVFYKTWYDKWSGTIHAGNGLENVGWRGGTDLRFKPMRQPEDVQQACVLAGWACLGTVESLMKFFEPGQWNAFERHTYAKIRDEAIRLRGDQLLKFEWR